MNLQYLRAYWKYRRKAKGRHGVHSPFVYAFVEGALKPPPSRYRYLAWPYKRADGKDDNWQPSLLVQRIIYYFDFAEVAYQDAAMAEPVRLVKEDGLWDDVKLPRVSGPLFRRLVIYQPAVGNADWKAFMDGLSEEDVVLYHLSTWNKESDWEAISHLPQVTLSIDLFRAGLLFFSKDFKVPQQFLLRYPL